MTPPCLETSSPNLPTSHIYHLSTHPVVSSLSLANYSLIVFSSDINPSRRVTLTFCGELSASQTPEKLPQSTQCWPLHLDSWHPVQCLEHSRCSIETGGARYLGTLAPCSWAGLPLQKAVPCPYHCSLEAQGTGIRWEMAHCAGEGPASLNTLSWGSRERERRK